MHRRQWIVGLFALGLTGFSQEGSANGKRPTRTLEVPRSFRLLEDPEWEERRMIIDRLANEHSIETHSLGDVLSSLNRRARWKNGPLWLFRDNGKRKKEAYPFFGGFIWDKQDSKTTVWYPQGITGSADAWPVGTIAGRRILLVSWYARTSAHKGARVTLVDVTDLEDIRYRHLLLVHPVERNGKVDFTPVPIHAGGIALYRNLLYVADTRSGVRVFDTDVLLKTSADPGKSKVGIIGGKAYAFDYRYALPMVGHYRQPARQRMRFSFVSLDRTSVPHALWVGEYSPTTREGFAASFSLDPATARLETGAGSSPVSESVLRFNRIRTQGFAAVHNAYVLNHTYSRDQYRLHIQTPNGYTAIKAPYGLEDLHYDPTLDRLWMLTEHPKSRAVFFNTAPDELR